MSNLKMNDNEIKAQKFLTYVAQHEKELKKAVKKNITYNEDIFDDVFQESIIKVYNTIYKNGTDIEDYKKYFFLSMKFTYILWDNRNKKHLERNIRNYWDDNKNDIEDDNTDYEEQFDKVNDTLRIIKDTLTEEFGKEETELYFVYQKMKITEGGSYQTLAERVNKPVNEVSSTVKKLKKYMENNEELRSYIDANNK